MLYRMFAAALFFTAPASLSHAAETGLSFCNKTPFGVNVAVGQIHGYSYFGKGWYAVKPGSCRKILSRDTSEGEYFYYAMSYDQPKKKIYWHGGKLPEAENEIFCIDKKAAFDNRGAMTCSDHGFKARKFRRINTGGQSAHTENITYSGPQSPAGTGETGVAKALAITGLLLGLGHAMEAVREGQEEDCMRQCTKSKTRCYKLCTQ